MENESPSSILRLRELIEKSDIKIKDKVTDHGCTPVMVAAAKGFAKIVKMFIEDYQIDVNAVDEDGWSLFHYIIKSTHSTETDNIEMSPENMGEYLVKVGADVKIIDEKGRSLVHHACRYPSPNYLEYLIEKHNLQIDLLDNYEEHPLLLCFDRTIVKREEKICDCINIFLKNGQDIKNIRNTEGKTILHLACTYTYYPIVVEYLVTSHVQFDVNVKDNSEQTPLYEIWESDNKKESILSKLKQIVKCLIDNDALLNTKDSNGLSPIDWLNQNGRNIAADILHSYE